MQLNSVSNNMDQDDTNGEVPLNNNEGVEFPDHENIYPDSPSLTQEELDDLAEELEYTNNSASLNKVRQRNFEVLNTILSEYLDSYIVIGYTAENDEVVATKIINSRDARAIASLLDDVVINNMGPTDSSLHDDDLD
jgi:hypothetical protein